MRPVDVPFIQVGTCTGRVLEAGEAGKMSAREGAGWICLNEAPESRVLVIFRLSVLMNR